MSSRAERRRRERGGSQPPRQRDPMTPIYIGLAVIIIAIFAGFGIVTWIQNVQRNNALNFELSTPTPGPNATQKPIQIQSLKAIGTVGFYPTPNPARGIFTDTPAGGQGQNPVDGIPCESMEDDLLHVHTHLALFVNGQQIQIPAWVGIVATSRTSLCLYWLHTHDATGIIHIEAGSATAPNGGPYTLGMFFDVWGEPLSRTQIGSFKGAVTAFVNGGPYEGDLAAIPLRAHQQIVLEMGKPVVAPPNYKFPSGD